MADDNQPLVVKPQTACRLLSIGTTRLYELIADGSIESYREGGHRRITMRSIQAYIERRVNADGGKFVSTYEFTGRVQPSRWSRN